MPNNHPQDRDMLVERLLKADPEFKKHYRSHRSLEEKLDEMNRRPGLSGDEEMERKRIQKEKLMHKDRMEDILRSAASVDSLGSIA